MLIVIFGIAFLLLGYVVYSRLLERIIKPYREPTPAYTKGDGEDYVPMSKWRNQLIQPLNIAVSLTIAAIATAIATTFYIKVIRKDLDDILGTNNGERSDGEI